MYSHHKFFLKMFRESLLVLLCATNVVAFGVAPITKPLAVSAVRERNIVRHDES